MWDVEVSQDTTRRYTPPRSRRSRPPKRYLGYMQDMQIHVGKDLVIDLKDGRKFQILGVQRALMDLSTYVILLDSSDHRRFRIRVLVPR